MNSSDPNDGTSRPTSTNKLGRKYLRGVPLPFELRQKVIDMLEEGKTPREISGELKIASVTVDRWHQRHLRGGGGSLDGTSRREAVESMDVKQEKQEPDDSDQKPSTAFKTGAMDSSDLSSSCNLEEDGENTPKQRGGSVSSGLSSLKHIQLSREASKRTIRRLQHRATSFSTASNGAASRQVPSERRLASKNASSSILSTDDAGSSSSTSAVFFSNNNSNNNNNNNSINTRSAHNYRSLRSSDLPRANVSPQAHSSVQLRESPLSPPPLTVPNHMTTTRRLDVPLSDRHCPITLVINPPPIVMATATPTTTEANNNDSTAQQPSTTTTYPTKIIIEIRYA